MVDLGTTTVDVKPSIKIDDLVPAKPINTD